MPVDPTVVIWRSALLPASETFVRHQGDALRRWRPTFVGATRVGSFNTRDTDVIAYPDTPGGRRAFLGLRLTGRSARLRRLLTRLDPGLVHAHFGGDGWLISQSAAQLGLPLVVTLHGHDVARQPHLPGVRGARHRRNLRTVFGRATLLLAVSDVIRRKAIDLGADPARVRVHHTGVPIPAASESPPKKWDVTFVGRFVEKKGIDDLVEAVATITEPRPRTLFVGAGPLLEQMRARATRLGLDATFLGTQEPSVVRRCMAESRLFVSPSKTAVDGDSEGLPTTILEAASLGLPTISTYHSGIPEAVVHGETGLLCDEGDRASLAALVRRALTDDVLRTRLGHQARRHVEAHFDLRRQTELLEDLYETAARRPAAPPHP